MTRQACAVARLTAGWDDAGHGISLHDHHRRYGELPSSRGRAIGGRDLIDQVAAAGLTGRGGAGFPTGAKMQAVAGRRGPAALIANGMESEPASEKDKALLTRAPHLVLDGIELAARAIGATTVCLCLPQRRRKLIAIVTEAVRQRQQARTGAVPVEIRELTGGYVASEETALVHWLNGGMAKPTATPPRPFERGVGKRPTMVANVETLAHVALIARHGAAWFRQTGVAEAPGTMLTTVTGAVARPGIYEIAGGTRTGDLLAAAQAQSGVEAVLVGGYFGTWHPVGQVTGLPFTKPGLSRAGAAPGAGVLFALQPGTCGLAEAARILRYLADESARQCGPCMFGLPAIASDLSQLAARHPQGDPLDRLQRRFRQIAGRGACRHPDGAVRMAESALTAFAADARAHSRGGLCLAADSVSRDGLCLPGRALSPGAGSVPRGRALSPGLALSPGHHP
ncbi:MAG TPA: NADH-ubiquinone oxidoreductase-F iron-sulfur binding region domain-containing protein [Streptosporangiaceae bacterium]|nr:NADH-ubiquinone oxidoreductase-F iron-sulfur binding region domain-containing protein [Streptosporangiaceae bacterium]